MTQTDANGERQTPKKAIEEAEELRDDLNHALRSVGIALPSLAVDCASDVGIKTPVLIELGRCNQDTARKLLNVLRNSLS